MSTAARGSVCILQVDCGDLLRTLEGLRADVRRSGAMSAPPVTDPVLPSQPIPAEDRETVAGAVSLYPRVVDVFWTIRKLAAAGGEVTSARLRARGFAKHTVWRALADLRAAGLIVTAVAPVTCDRAIALTARGERAGKEDLKVRSRPQGRYWTEGETRRAERMREENHSAIEIAAALGRTVESVKAKLAYFSPRGAKGEGEPRPAVSAFALAQRERRCVAAGCRNLTAELMGDPPPGFSALDRKRAAEPKPETKRI